jgi:prepilin-type N-terminal cleavage/methylation domain-containing protein
MKKITPIISSIRGFTLIETLVAISILLIAISGPFYAIQKAITSSNIARDQLIASALSQEAIEQVYSVRDSNYLLNNQGNTFSWLSGLDGTSDGYHYTDCFAQDCTVDSYPDDTPGLVFAACPGSCAPLNLSTDNIYTQHSGFPATKFTRKLRLATITGNEVRVVSTVSWSFQGTDYSVILTDEIYNWL